MAEVPDLLAALQASIDRAKAERVAEWKEQGVCLGCGQAEGRPYPHGDDAPGDCREVQP